MQWLTDMPIRGKLLMITVLSCAIVLVLAGTMIVAFQFSTYRAQKTLEAEAQAQILAASAAPSLVFDDAKATQDYLNALKVNNQIAEAAIYKSGGLFASYVPAAQEKKPLPGRLEFAETHFEGADLLAYAPIREEQRQIGFVYLRVSTEPLIDNVMRNGAIILAVMLGSLLLMLPFSLRMHAIIAKPIRDIAEAARLVAAGEIAALDIHGKRNDEIGLLEQQFNKMAMSLQEKAALAKRISTGDLSVAVTPQSEKDVLGNAFVSMTRDLQEKAALATQIADGNLTVEVKPRGEQDVLGNAFAVMADNLRKMNRSVSEGIMVLAGAASEILAGTSQLADSATKTATSIAQTTATVEEVKQTTLLTNQKAKNVSEAAQRATLVSQEGRKAVEESIEGMLQIRQQMELIAESIVRLSEQSQAIGEIIATVNDLAEQSNLLAVNASIEAAKAGEHGKGFAVVAQEVKSLAVQSRQATAQVRSILGDIQKATGSAVSAAERGSRVVEAGARQSKSAGEAIVQLADSIAESANAATQIAASTQQQLAGMDQLGYAMESIRVATRQNADSTKQAEAAANGLHDLGQELKTLIARYRI